MPLWPSLKRSDGSHHLGQRDRLDVIRATMRRVGPSVTVDDVNEALRKLDEPGINLKSFANNYRRVFGGSQPAVVTEVAPVEPVIADPVTLRDLLTTLPGREVPDERWADVLEDCVRLRAACEAVGGLRRARWLLEVLERLEGCDERPSNATGENLPVSGGS